MNVIIVTNVRIVRDVRDVCNDFDVFCFPAAKSHIIFEKKMHPIFEDASFFYCPICFSGGLFSHLHSLAVYDADEDALRRICDFHALQVVVFCCCFYCRFDVLHACR